MTDGGWKKHGVIFAPSDALDTDPVILHYFRSHVEKIHVIEEGKEYLLNSIRLSTPVKHVHSVDTYGVNIIGSNHTISYISDTKYFSDLSKHYPGDIMILNVVLQESKEHIDHLSIKDSEKIIMECNPKICLLTHFGMTMIKSKPWKIAEEISKRTGVHTVAAYDGLNIDIDSV
jgi:phosphoribosyl 1,2-cyclic phosphodiesterase